MPRSDSSPFCSGSSRFVPVLNFWLLSRGRLLYSHPSFSVVRVFGVPYPCCSVISVVTVELLCNAVEKLHIIDRAAKVPHRFCVFHPQIFQAAPEIIGVWVHVTMPLCWKFRRPYEPARELFDRANGDCKISSVVHLNTSDECR